MEKVKLLSQSPLFEMLRDQELVFVADLARAVEKRKGELLFEEGEVGDGLFVLTHGEVEVTQKGPSGKAHPLAVLGAFQYVGEMGVLEKTSRSATVRARTDVRLLCLTAEDLTTFRGAYPDGYLFLLLNLARELSARLRVGNQRLVSLLDGAG